DRARRLEPLSGGAGEGRPVALLVPEPVQPEVEHGAQLVSEPVQPGADQGAELVPEPVPAPAPAPAPPARLTPLSPQRFGLQLTIGQETHDLLRYAQSLLGHRVPSGDLEAVIRFALES